MKSYLKICFIDLIFPFVVWTVTLLTFLAKQCCIPEYNQFVKLMGESVYIGLFLPGGIFVLPALIFLWISNILFLGAIIKRSTLGIVYIQGSIVIVPLLSLVMFGKYLRLIETIKIEKDNYNFIDMIKLYGDNSSSAEIWLISILLVSYILFLIIKYFLVKIVLSHRPRP